MKSKVKTLVEVTKRKMQVKLSSSRRLLPSRHRQGGEGREGGRMGEEGRGVEEGREGSEEEEREGPVLFFFWSPCCLASTHLVSWVRLTQLLRPSLPHLDLVPPLTCLRRSLGKSTTSKPVQPPLYSASENNGLPPPTRPLINSRT